MRNIFIFSFSILTLGASAQSKEFLKLMESGNSKYSVKNYTAALADYDKAIGLISADVDKFVSAKKALPDDKRYMLEPYVKRANCFYFKGNSALMRSDLEKIGVMDPENRDAQLLKGYNKYKSGDKIGGCAEMQAVVQKGAELGKKIIEDCFCWSEAVNLTKEGVSLVNLKKYDEAIAKFNTAISITPDSGSVYGERAKAYMGKGMNEEALKDLNTAVSKNTGSYRVYYLRGQAFMKNNKADSAFMDLSKCLELKKDFFDGYMLRAEAAEQMEKYNAAVFDYDQCIRLRPEFGLSYYKSALVKHNHLEDLLGACDMYKAAADRGVEEAKSMAANCASPKYMKQHLHKSKKGQ